MKFELTPRQTQAWQLLFDNQVALRKLLYGGAKGGGKSFFLCVWALAMCRYLINLWSLPVSDSPLPVGFLGRKHGVDFKKTTLATWRKVIPASCYAENKADQTLVIDGRVQLDYGGLDSQDTINKFNSAEYAFGAIDQAEETDRADIGVLEGALRLIVGGIQPPYRMLYTANPAECWLKNVFPVNSDQEVIGSAEHCYVPALYTDNPHLPDNYSDTLDSAFSYDPVRLAAYKTGNWDLLLASDVVIASDMVASLKGVHHVRADKRRVCVCDPSTGGDECVIYVIENGHIIDEMYLHEEDTMKIAAQMTIIAARNDTDYYAVDSIGVGKGVYDKLQELGKNVKAIISSEAQGVPAAYKNLRAQMWWEARQKIMDKQVPYLEGQEELYRQLTAVKFALKNGKIQMELKADTKRRLSRSPDRADTYIYGLFALDSAPCLVERARAEEMRSTKLDDYRGEVEDWRAV